MASDEAVRQHLRSVATSGNAGELLAAAMLWQTFGEEWKAKGAISSMQASMPGQEARAWFDTARAARPRDVRVAWIEANGCAGLSEICESEDALHFLLQAEPDNAAVHLLALAMADKHGDEKAVDAYWRSAAQAKFFDAHVLDIGRLMHSIMRGVAWPPLPSRLSDAMGVSFGLGRPATVDDVADVEIGAIWAAMALPSYSPVSNACKEGSLKTAAQPGRLECERVLKLLAEDRSIVISPMVGLTLLVRLRSGSVEGSAWRERLRQLYWTYENHVDDMSAFGHGAPTPGEYMTWFMTEGELPAMERLLELRGKPVQAPAGWLPRTERYRALVTTGRDPQA